MHNQQVTSGNRLRIRNKLRDTPAKVFVLFVLALGVSQAANARATNPPQISVFDTGAENHAGLTFAPDGTTAFWVAWNGKWGSSANSQKTIYTSRLQNGEWSTPSTVEFSGDHSDDDPFVSPDGRWLYFVSDRPLNDNDQVADTNIWRYDLTDKSSPEYVSINSDSEEYSPVVVASGTLYFASGREGGPGQGDFYKAKATSINMGGCFESPTLLGPAFNTPTGEWNLWVSAEEDEIIFEASSRETNVSIPGDLYYSRRTTEGWTLAVPVSSLNSTNSELLPRMHPDGETLYYTSAPIGGHAEILTTNLRLLRESLQSP